LEEEKVKDEDLKIQKKEEEKLRDKINDGLFEY
jgi:hypothetical protein